MTSRERIRAVVDRHVAPVGTADADAYVGREAIRAQFASVLTRRSPHA